MLHLIEIHEVIILQICDEENSIRWCIALVKRSWKILYSSQFAVAIYEVRERKREGKKNRLIIALHTSQMDNESNRWKEKKNQILTPIHGNWNGWHSPIWTRWHKMQIDCMQSCKAWIWRVPSNEMYRDFEWAHAKLRFFILFFFSSYLSHPIGL